MASSGVIFNFIQAKETTKFILPDGVDPGLKSVARAKGTFESIIFLAFVYGIPKKNEHDGSATGIVSDFDNMLRSSSVNTSK